MCSFLDPRFKALPFADDHLKTAIHSKVQRALMKMGYADEAGQADQSAVHTSDGRDEDNVSSNNSKLDVLLDADLYDSSSASVTNISFDDRLRSEVNRYLVFPNISMLQSPFTWWKEQCQNLPMLGMLARWCLVITASSVPSERVLSAADDLISAKQNRLHPDNVNMLMFLHQNLKQEPSQ